MEQTFAEWYAENTDADYDTVVEKVEWYILRAYNIAYNEGLDCPETCNYGDDFGL